MKDKHLRSLAKSLSYRICGTIVTSVIVFLFTRKWTLSLAIGAVDFASKLATFYLHERVWSMILWGSAVSQPLLSKYPKK